MSFTNPFAQASQSLGGDEEVSIEYFNGNPNPQTIENSQVVILIKNLLRKDPTTRRKASQEFLELIPNLDIDNSIHLAWIQLYAKLALDVSPEVRALAHTILQRLYQKLGKKSSKYLKDSICLLFCGIFDPDLTCSEAANTCFEVVFNSDEKRSLVIEKFSNKMVDFVINLFTVQTPATLSDERYVSTKESRIKYERILKQGVDFINAHLVLKSQKLLDSGKFWKLIGSNSAALSRTVMNLAISAVDLVDSKRTFLFGELLKSMRRPDPLIAKDLVRAVLTYVKRNPDLWTEDAHLSLKKLIKNSSAFQQNFWPLAFNLTLQDPKYAELLPTFASVALEKTGPCENDIWGCFLTLSVRAQNTELVCESVYERCKRNISPQLQAIIGQKFKIIGHSQLAVGFLEDSNDQQFLFAKVLAITQLYRSELAAISWTSHQIAVLVALDPELPIDVKFDDNDLKSMLEIAIHSKLVDSQEFVDKIAKINPNLVMQNARALSSKGVRLELSSDVEQSVEMLESTARAHGEIVNAETSVNALETLLTRGVNGDEESLDAVARLAIQSPKFVNDVLLKTQSFSNLLTTLYLRSPLTGDLDKLFNALSLEDSPELLISSLQREDLHNVDVAVERALRLIKRTDRADDILLLNEEWVKEDDLWPDDNARGIYPILYPVGKGTAKWSNLLNLAVYLVNVCNNQTVSRDLKQKCVVKLALVSSSAMGFKYTSEDSELVSIASALISEVNELLTSFDIVEDLWELVSSNNSSLAFHAAQLLHDEDAGNERCLKYRNKLQNLTVCGALLSQKSSGKGLHWYDRSQQQLYASLESKVDSSTLAMIDPQWNPDKLELALSSKFTDLEGPVLQDALRLVSVGSSAEHVTHGLRASKFSQALVLKQVKLGDFSDEIVRAAASQLFGGNSELDIYLAQCYLEHCKLLVDKDIGFHADVPVDSPTVAWVSYCCRRGHECAKYREQLESSDYVDVTPSFIPGGALVDWLLYLDIVTEYNKGSSLLGRKVLPPNVVFGDDVHVQKHILGFISDELKKGLDVPKVVNIEDIDEAIQNRSVATLQLFFKTCTELGGSVRQWFRDITDRNLQTKVSNCLETYISPALMRSLSKQVQDLRQDGVLQGVAVSEKAREFRALIDVDESVATILITIDPLFPAKLAKVSISGLSGVPEHTRRGWVLEAEYTIQNSAIVNAMRTLCIKVRNFLEGIEPCAICYSVMLGKSLPNKTCSNCKNTYHSDCLYKWFQSNKGEKLCPMCRTPM